MSAQSSAEVVHDTVRPASAPPANPTSRQHLGKALSASTETNRSKTLSKSSADKSKSKKSAVTLSMNEDLNDEYLRTCIENNKADTELKIVKKEKVLLEIRLLTNKLNDFENQLND